MNRDNFLQSLLQPNSPNLLFGILGILVFAIVGEFVAALLIEPEGITLFSIVRITIAIIILMMLAYILWKRRSKVVFRWSEGDPLPRDFKGLIVVLSSPGIVKTLLDYHRNRITHVWVITNFKNQAYSHYISTEVSVQGVKTEEIKGILLAYE
jgi:hypothetical protein